MKKLLVFGILLILLSSIAFAGMCSETDDKKDFEEQGDTKYGITTFTDTCVISPNADMSTEESSFLKEYYCSDDKRKSDIIDCLREGYEKCKNGRCIAAEGTDVTQKTVYTPVACGDKKVNQAIEECDPPGKICYKGNDIGQCTDTCKCEVMVKVEDTEEEPETTEETIDEPEETPEPELIAEPKIPSKSEDMKKPAPRPSAGDREDLPEIKEPGFFGKIWRWFTGIFS